MQQNEMCYSRFIKIGYQQGRKSQFIYFHKHTKITATCGATISENDLKMSRTVFLQLRIEKAISR